MDREEAWNQFAATGNVKDYLKYREKDTMNVSEKSAGESRRHERNGNTYRDDISSITDERVR